MKHTLTLDGNGLTVNTIVFNHRVNITMNQRAWWRMWRKEAYREKRGRILKIRPEGG